MIRNRASTPRTRRHPVAVSVVLLATLLLPGHESAGEPPKVVPPFRQLLEEYKVSCSKPDVKEQVRLLTEVCRVAAEAVADPKDPVAVRRVNEDKANARLACRQALASRENDLVVAAMGGYAALAIPGSSGDLRSFADARLAKRRPQMVRLAALSAWGAIADPGTHETLLEYVRLPSREQERQDLASRAARALGLYSRLPKGGPRYAFLKDFMQMFDGIYNSGMLFMSADASHWWGLLHPLMVESFNSLTGAGSKDYPGCVEWWRDNRRAVQAGRK